MHQVRQLEIGVLTNQFAGFLQRFPVLAVANEFVNLDQLGFGLSGRLGTAGRVGGSFFRA